MSDTKVVDSVKQIINCENASSDIMEIKDLIFELVKAMVDKPEKIEIDVNTGQRTTVININTDKDDIGKVIGKGGNNITAMRGIMENIAAKNKSRISINVID